MKWFFLLLAGLVGIVPLEAQKPANGQAWRFQLLDGSGIMDDCLICGRPSFWVPLRGSFDVIGTSNAQMLQVTNFNFASDLSASPDYIVMGGGALDLSKGDPELTAEIVVQHLGTAEIIHLTNQPPDGTRIFPMISVIAGETPSTLARKYHLQIKAAPIQELWFSTTKPLNDHSPGDLFSNGGRVVKANSELTEKLSLIEPLDISLDALDIGPRGEIFFSSATNAESFVNGTIGHGDIVTSGGRIYLQSFQLLSAFGVDDPEAGLDALHIKSEDEVYFSVTKEVTRSNGAKLRRGDILSNKGQILRSEPNLLLRFQNPFTNSVGVDALHIWPNGEIWFSTETSFDSAIGPIDDGDVISDQGYVVLRNADVVARFKPSPTNVSFGLDALTVISDASASAALTQILEISFVPGLVDLRWESAARVFQVEKAGDVDGPWLPLTDVVIERSFLDATPDEAGFYRVRQW